MDCLCLLKIGLEHCCQKICMGEFPLRRLGSRSIVSLFWASFTRSLGYEYSWKRHQLFTFINKVRTGGRNKPERIHRKLQREFTVKHAHIAMGLSRSPACHLSANGWQGKSDHFDPFWPILYIISWMETHRFPMISIPSSIIVWRFCRRLHIFYFKFPWIYVTSFSNVHFPRSLPFFPQPEKPRQDHTMPQPLGATLLDARLRG